MTKFYCKKCGYFIPANHAEAMEKQPQICICDRPQPKIMETEEEP